MNTSIKHHSSLFSSLISKFTVWVYSFSAAQSTRKTDTIGVQSVNIVDYLAARYFPQDRLRTDLKEAEYWTYVHKLAKKMSPNE